MAYILDGAVILIFILAIFIGYKRGFVKAAIRLVGCILAAIIAGVLSPVIAGGIFDTFASDKLQQTISSGMTTTDASSAAEGIGKALESLPAPVLNALEACGLSSPAQIVENVKDSLNGTVDALSETVVTKVLRPVAVALPQTLCFFILFILLMIVVGILAGLINKVFKLPLLKQMNGGLGAVVGAAEGLVLLFVAVTVVQLAAASSGADAFISQKDIDDSFVVSRMAEFNPLTGPIQVMLDKLPV